MSRLLMLCPLLILPEGVATPEIAAGSVLLSVLDNCINLLKELRRNFDSLLGLFGLEDLSLPTKLRLSLLLEGGLGLKWLSWLLCVELR